MGVRAILMPDVGEGVAEAEIVEWPVKVGDHVREDQVVAAVMTDKATVEIPTPFAGIVLALGGSVGEVLAVGSELIRIDAPDLSDVAPPVARVETPPPVAREETVESARAEAAEPPSPPGDKPLASPAVRQRAREAGLDLRSVRGTGPDGRVTHADVDAHLRPPAAKTPNLSVETVKIVGLRRRIAQNMAESTRRVAHFSYVEEVDVTALEDLRATLNAGGEAAPRLTLLPFLMLALVKAVAEFPEINAHYDDEQEVVRRFGAVHIGVATQTPQGLAVPVVRHAETLDLYQAAREMKRVTEAARANVATRDELSGSTITLSSLGPMGGIVTTPVVNRPEVAIVGVNKIAMRPVWRDNAIVPRKMMNLSSSFDHRVVDGFDAASFIQRVRTLIEMPALLFIEEPGP